MKLADLGLIGWLLAGILGGVFVLGALAFGLGLIAHAVRGGGL